MDKREQCEKTFEVLLEHTDLTCFFECIHFDVFSLICNAMSHVFPEAVSSMSEGRGGEGRGGEGRVG